MDKFGSKKFAIKFIFSLVIVEYKCASKMRSKVPNIKGKLSLAFSMIIHKNFE